MGRAVAQRLHGQGVNVFILDVDREGGAALAASLGERAAFRAADITDDEQVGDAIADAAGPFGDIHICCSFAGVALLGRTVGSRGPMPMATFRRCIEVNLCGTFNVVRLCAERMCGNAVLADGGGRGCIVTVSSVAAFQGPAGTVEEVARLTQCIVENDYIHAECIRIDGGKRV